MSPTTTAMATVTNPGMAPIASTAFTPRLDQMFYRMTALARFESA